MSLLLHCPYCVYNEKKKCTNLLIEISHTGVVLVLKDTKPLPALSYFTLTDLDKECDKTTGSCYAFIQSIIFMAH